MLPPEMLVGIAAASSAASDAGMDVFRARPSRPRETAVSMQARSRQT